ncbi:MAG: hypothetical protein ACD_8C00056G0022 [uncultured bacterium]|nr:MAG: hypothetical protein ACD_8C00056G0022 [uncultured bacterium]
MKKQKQNLIKYGLGLLVFVSVFVAAGAIKASILENGNGWMWGGSDDGATNSTGFGWVSMNNTTSGGTTSYGVNIPPTDGDLSGWVWSENVGWISFNSVDLAGCPSGTCSARRVGNAIVGWARILSIRDAGANAGGWSGWISLSGSSYEVSISGATLSGYAWSDELGWIDFSKVSLNIPDPVDGLTVCQDSCDSGLLVGATRTMDNGSTYTYKACYNTSITCDLVLGDVTSDPATTWSEANSSGGAVEFNGDGIVNAIAVGSETVTATYNPGTGDISKSFDANVQALPVRCGSADGGSFSSAPTSGLCTDASTPPVTLVGTAWNWDCADESGCSAAQTTVPTGLNWREVAP